MKKIDLIHTTILIVAILAGYSAITTFIYLLASIAYAGNSEYLHLSPSRIMYSLIATGLFSAACIALIRNARRYSMQLLRDEPEGSWEDASKWDLDRRNILLVLFIGIGLHTLIPSASLVLSDAYMLFKDKVSNDLLRTENPPKTSDLIVELLRVTIGTFLVYAAPNLTNFIEKNITTRLDSKS